MRPGYGWRGSVRLRLTLWNVGVLALVLTVLGGALVYTLRADLTASLDRDLSGVSQGRFGVEDQVDFFLFRDPDRLRPQATGPAPPRRPGGPPDRTRRDRFTLAGYTIRRLGMDGRPLTLFPSDGPLNAGLYRQSRRGRSLYASVPFHSEPVRVFSFPLRHDGRIVGVAQVARPLGDLQRQVRRVIRTLLALSPLALLIAGAGGAFLTDRALRPVRGITQAAGRIEASDLSGRLPVTGSDEFSEMAATFNGMLARLEDSFHRLTTAYEQQRRFAADASHELRTPLTIIKANTSLALLEARTAAEYRRTLETVDRAADRTNRIVQDLLLLARSDAGQLRLRTAPLPLRDVLEQARDEAATPDAAPVFLELPITRLGVVGDAEALGRLFGNLLTNALRHTPGEGRVVIGASADSDQVIVTVRDTGEGIPAEHLPHVCERFYRVDAARSGAQGGTGLGLAICRSIAEAHGGTLAVASVYGAGATVTVTLPRAVLPAPEAAPQPALTR